MTRPHKRRPTTKKTPKQAVATVKKGARHIEKRPTRSKSSVVNDRPDSGLCLPTIKELRRPDGAARFLEGVRKSMRTLETGYRKRLREEIARVYAAALVLAHDADAWSDFCRAPDWSFEKKRPTPSNQQDALRYAFRFATGFSKGGAKRANRYFQATKAMFNEQMPPDQVLAKLEKTTLTKLVRRKPDLEDESPGLSVRSARVDTDVAPKAKTADEGGESRNPRADDDDSEDEGWLPLKLRHPELVKTLMGYKRKDKVKIIFIIESTDAGTIRGKMTRVSRLNRKRAG
jgi:hypothetical protein